MKSNDNDLNQASSSNNLKKTIHFKNNSPKKKNNKNTHLKKNTQNEQENTQNKQVESDWRALLYLMPPVGMFYSTVHLLDDLSKNKFPFQDCGPITKSLSWIFNWDIALSGMAINNTLNNKKIFYGLGNIGKVFAYSLTFLSAASLTYSPTLVTATLTLPTFACWFFPDQVRNLWNSTKSFFKKFTKTDNSNLNYSKDMSKGKENFISLDQTKSMDRNSYEKNNIENNIKNNKYTFSQSDNVSDKGKGKGKSID